MSFAEYSGYIHKTLNNVDSAQVENLIKILFQAFCEGTSVFVLGNGGSAANASHFAQDLAKGTCLSLDQLKRIKAQSLTDNTPYITALGNDNGFDCIFEQQLRTYAVSGDIVIAISGSGNSPNILRAIEWANKNQMITIGVTGFNGGTLRQINQHSLHIPLNDMCSTESIHSVVFHYVILELQRKIKDFLTN